VLRTRLASQDGLLSFIAFPRVITTSREHLPVLPHHSASLSGSVVPVIAAASAMRVPGAGEHGTHEHAHNEGNQRDDENGLDIRVDHHVETP
jgi:hypothetical protein